VIGSTTAQHADHRQQRHARDERSADPAGRRVGGTVNMTAGNLITLQGTGSLTVSAAVRSRSAR